MKIISFGGGVQTVALALMCIDGKIEMPDCAVFADPKWELPQTYTYLDWFIPYCKERGLLIKTVSSGNIREDALDSNRRWTTMPLFTLDENGKKGMLRRQCTNDYKIQPVYKEVRNLLGLKPYQRAKEPAEIWLGISMDEVVRMKPSRVKFAVNRFPLIENNLSRNDCVEYIKNSGFELPPKSACIGCPFHSDDFWRTLKVSYPDQFADAVAFDEKIRFNTRKGLKNPVFLHKSCKPLSEIDFMEDQMDLFGEECEGYCGL